MTKKTRIGKNGNEKDDAPNPEIRVICADLERQHRELDHILTSLDETRWQAVTPFYGWTLMDQVAHIAFFDHEALLAMENPDQFQLRAGPIMEVLKTGKSLKAHTNALLDIDAPATLLTFWREARTRMVRLLEAMDPKARIPWYGPDMGCLSFATGRLMEAWAHGQDVLDTLKIRPFQDNRLFHIAHLGISAFAWSFKIKQLPVPHTRPHVQLTSPSGKLWEWGDDSSTEKVRGDALSFCLVATQRRHVLDTPLEWEGEIVGRWLSIAQAFAGVSQEPPRPGERIVQYPPTPAHNQSHKDEMP